MIVDKSLVTDRRMQMPTITEPLDVREQVLLSLVPRMVGIVMHQLHRTSLTDS